MDALRRYRSRPSKLKTLLTKLHLRAQLFSSEPLVQNMSHLLSALPLEVHLQIYAEVLDFYGTVQHITLTDGKLTHMRCYDPQSHKCFQDRELYFNDRSFGKGICNLFVAAHRARARDGWEIMPLLLSCRRM